MKLFKFQIDNRFKPLVERLLCSNRVTEKIGGMVVGKRRFMMIDGSIVPGMSLQDAVKFLSV